MLAADTELDVRTRPAAELDGRAHYRAHTVGVERRERVLVENLLLLIDAQELADVIAGESERELCQVVRAKGEELRLLGDLVGGHRAAGDLDHRADEIIHLDALLFHDLGRDTVDDYLLVAELLHVADERDHD